MKATIKNIEITTEETILTSCISSPTEIIFLLSNHSVYRYNIKTKEQTGLFNVKTYVTYSDGGFDINSPSTIYTLDDIVVLANDYKLHSIVHYPNKYKSLRLQREDYHAGISKFPISLFKNDKGIPHLIYGVAWNHVQILNLDTRQILTAAKSLIEVNAVEDHIEFYKKNKEDNKHTWPRSYDYFYGELMMSPDSKQFLSAGWVWGSNDAYVIYDLEHFITNNKIKDNSIGGWEHENRATCWISNDTVAVAYHPASEGEESATKDTPSEIHLYDIQEEITLKEKLIIPNINLSRTTFRYSKKANAIVVFSDKMGVWVINLKGDVLFKDADLQMDNYYTDLDLGIKTRGKSIDIISLFNRPLETN